ncbi:MAG: hypothetical protein KDM64_12010, partial [Verrucomicrobiae bacterium]|nr:hypothetical protein [Verrucomicrobiae bacterium]
MSREKQDSGAIGWFLGRFFRSPSSYVGILSALGMGAAASSAGVPVSGAIGLGSLVGIAVGALSFLIWYGIKSSHRKATELRKEANVSAVDESLLKALRESGEPGAARLLEKLCAERNAIMRQVEASEDSGSAEPMLALATAILSEASRRADELADLARRRSDAHLESPANAEERMSAIRVELETAYGVVVDAKSGLREGEWQATEDWLSSPGTGSLTALTAQLSEEMTIAR